MGTMQDWSKVPEDPPDPDIDFLGSFPPEESQTSIATATAFPTATASTSMDYVTVAMLELVRGHLKEALLEQVTTIKGELGKEGEERKENDTRLTKCIEKLMKELLKLSGKMNWMQKRIEEMEKWRSQSGSEPPPLSPISFQNASTSEELNLEIEIKETYSLSEVKIENDDEGRGNDPLYPIVSIIEDPLGTDHPPPAPHNVTGSRRHLSVSGHVENPRPFRLCNVGRLLSSAESCQSRRSSGDEVGNASYPVPIYDDEDNADDSGLGQTLPIRDRASSSITTFDQGGEGEDMSPEGIGFIHGRAPASGRSNHVQFLCFCGIEFNSGDELTAHIGEQEEAVVEVEEESVPTSNSFSDGNSTNQHVEIELPMATSTTRKGRKHAPDPSQPLRCLCGLQFSYNVSLNRHIKKLAVKDKHVGCKMCGRHFQYAYELKYHLRRVQELGRCPKPRPRKRQKKLVGGRRRKATRRSRSIFSSQTQTNDPDPIPGISSSPIPDSTTSTLTPVQGHEENPSIPLSCLCGAKCRDKGALYQHIRYYNETRRVKRKVLAEKPNPKSKSNVKATNRRTSNNDQQQQQHGFGKQGRDENGRIRHFCKCGKSYNAKAVLDRHILGDSLKKQFICNLCSYPFYFHSQLRSHMSSKHKMKYDAKRSIFACTSCTAMFGHIKELMRHRRAVHTKPGGGINEDASV